MNISPNNYILSLIVILLISSNTYVYTQAIPQDSVANRIEAYFEAYADSADVINLYAVANMLPQVCWLCKPPELKTNSEGWLAVRKNRTELYLRFILTMLEVMEEVGIGPDFDRSDPRYAAVRTNSVVIITIPGEEDAYDNYYAWKKVNDANLAIHHIFDIYENGIKKLPCFYKHNYKRNKDKFRVMKEIITTYLEENNPTRYDQVMTIIRKALKKKCDRF